MTNTPPDEATMKRLARMAREDAHAAAMRDKLKATRAKDAHIRKIMRLHGEPLPGSVDEAAARRRTRNFKADIRATRVVRVALLMLGDRTARQ